MNPKYTDKQEILNKVYKHFIVYKNPRCVKHPEMLHSACVYKGTGCAVGCLLDYEDRSKWDDIFGSLGPSSIFKEEYNKYFANNLINFLMDLQVAHDQDTSAAFRFNETENYSSFEEAFSSRLKFIANKYELQFPGDRHDQILESAD